MFFLIVSLFILTKQIIYIQRSQCGYANKVERKPCYMPTNQYSSFGSWSQCSASCGNGIQTRIAVSIL